ncbi:phage regulatory CII family protein [Mesorhizobium captivum]|uniref:phage regulatory CII family protein n=1 Tax=Mesorhizobium captivum TaxID=3072319 RepID=UPI002A23AB0F|nr:phage regulatory CII family protein [Mesorhizobium sp. VK23E]MDX8513566.1 phage regulatory CII family protein [Mesorhizobium sp. VK23E]
MKLPRKITETERLDLKAATRAALEMARPTKFALVTRVDAPALSNYGSPSEPEKFMPIDVVVDLCRDIGSPAIVEEMARMLGFRLAPIAEAEAGGQVGVGDIAAISKEANDVVGTIARGLADGRLDGAETREARKEIAENIRALHQLDRKLGGSAA